MKSNVSPMRLAANSGYSTRRRPLVLRRLPRGGRGEPGRFSQAHEGVAYGCCVPALTRFTYPHCPGPPRLTLTPAVTAEIGETTIVGHRWTRFKGKMENGRMVSKADIFVLRPIAGCGTVNSGGSHCLASSDV